jgi:hypothetical protein
VRRHPDWNLVWVTRLMLTEQMLRKQKVDADAVAAHVVATRRHLGRRSFATSMVIRTIAVSIRISKKAIVSNTTWMEISGQ